MPPTGAFSRQNTRTARWNIHSNASLKYTKIFLKFYEKYVKKYKPMGSGVPRGGVWGVQTPPRNSEDIGEVLDRISKKNRHLDYHL